MYTIKTNITNIKVKKVRVLLRFVPVDLVSDGSFCRALGFTACTL